MTERREFSQAAVDAKILVPKSNPRIQITSEDQSFNYGYVARHVSNSDGTYLWFKVRQLVECIVEGKKAYLYPTAFAGEVFEQNEYGEYYSTIREAEAKLLPLEQFKVYDYSAPSISAISYLTLRLLHKKGKQILTKANPLRSQSNSPGKK